MRPGWDEYFMHVAETVAARATCPRASVGAVLVRDHRILTTGYNGAPRHVAHCSEVGATAYCTHQPCVACAKLFISAGVRRIVYRDPYLDPFAQRLLAEAHVELTPFALPETAGAVT
jgi:dCMP deaminase